MPNTIIDSVELGFILSRPRPPKVFIDDMFTNSIIGYRLETRFMVVYTMVSATEA